MEPKASILWFLIWLAADLDTQIFVSLLCLIARMSYSLLSFFPHVALSTILTSSFYPSLLYYQFLLQWHGNKKKGGKFIEASPVKKAATSAEFLFCFFLSPPPFPPPVLMIISGGVSACSPVVNHVDSDF
jgi:hypothetical protein